MRSHMIVVILTLVLAGPLRAQDAAITYQGQLRQSGAPFTGLADLEFGLHTELVGGSQLGPTQLRDDWPIEDGLFQVELDFGPGAFTGPVRYLEVRVNGVLIAPRQAVRPSPMALFALAGNEGPTGPPGAQGPQGDQGPAGPPGDSHWQLNASNTYYDAGNVGIGTAVPISPLHVVSDAFGSAVFAQNQATGGRGVFGVASATSGLNFGVYGISSSTDGHGVFGWATASSGPSSGVMGESNSTSGDGVVGLVRASSGLTVGVRGESGSTDGRGVLGSASASSGTNYGVLGQTGSAAGWGVFSVGSMGASGTKSFVIDHPLDPENHYLRHYSAEGPEPQNVYNGNATLDDRGEARIELPDYFAAVNRDPRYTLTPVGAPMPNLHVIEEIDLEQWPNSFRIAGGQPGMRVSWEVKAVRDDPFVRANGVVVEQEKTGAARGTYLHPELYGQPPERGEHHRHGSAEALQHSSSTDGQP